MATQRRSIEVIDLVSDGESDSDQRPASHPRAEMDIDSDSGSEAFATPPRLPIEPANEDMHAQAFQVPALPEAGTFVDVDGEQIFIPHEQGFAFQEGFHDAVLTEAGPTDADMAWDRQIALALNHDQLDPADTGLSDPSVSHDRDLALALGTDQVNSADDCLQRVLEIFPDVSHDYIHTLYNDFERQGDYEILPASARLDNIIEQLVSATSYPKQEKGKKRKREESIVERNDTHWEQKDRAPVPHYLKGSMQAILKAEFPDIPIQYINDTLGAEKHLYHAFVLLARIKDTSDQTKRPYGKGRPSSKNLADAATIAINCGWPELLEELGAARKSVEALRSARAEEDAKKKAEEDNLQRAIAAGETAECSACFDDLPMNRQMHCDGTVAHFTCLGCMETYIKAEVGDARCRVLCPAGCGGGFAYSQLDFLSDKPLLEKLAQLQQEKDIRDAGLDNLEECPFCDYKAIVPPVEEDFEFRCANPECEKVSCRRCKSISHIPMSCEEHAKDLKVNSRHKIEEAMTAALVRSCNKCKKQFIKEFGCNKMTCTSCGNLQCYVCSATVKDYNHFEQNAPGGPGRPPTAATPGKAVPCPLYDNVEERHEREVKEAEAAARAQVVQENPNVSPEDLDINMSEAVRKSTENRIRQAGGPGGGGGMMAHAPIRPPHFDRVPPAGGERLFEVALQQAHRQRPAVARINAAQQADRARLMRGNRIPAPAAAAENPGLGQRLQGYIPMLGYPGAALPPPGDPRRAANVQQLPNVVAPPGNRAGDPFADDPFNDFALALDGAGDVDRFLHGHDDPLNNNINDNNNQHPFHDLFAPPAPPEAPPLLFGAQIRHQREIYAGYHQDELARQAALARAGHQLRLQQQMQLLGPPGTQGLQQQRAGAGIPNQFGGMDEQQARQAPVRRGRG